MASYWLFLDNRKARFDMIDRDRSGERLARLDARMTEVTQRRALRHRAARDLRPQLLAQLDQMLSEFPQPDPFVRESADMRTTSL